MRRRVGLHGGRLRARGFIGSSHGLPGSWRLTGHSTRGLRLPWSLRAHVRRCSLPLVKRGARRCGLSDGNHLPVQDRGRRLHHHRSTGSHDAGADWLHSNITNHGSALELFGIHFGDVGRNRACVHECIARNHRHRVVHVLVGVGNPVDVRIVVSDIRRVVVYDRGVVNVGHLGHIDVGVGDVHIVHVPTTGAIGRNENLARRQREPGYTNARIHLRQQTPPAPGRTPGERTPDPAPSTMNSPQMPNVRSGRAQNPKVRLQPRSSPKARPKPSGRIDTEPIRVQLRPEPTLDHSRPRSASGRTRRDRRRQSSPAKCSSTTRRGLHVGHGRKRSYRNRHDWVSGRSHDPAGQCP